MPSTPIKSVKELGSALRAARLAMGLTITDAALACGVGRRFYLEIEQGKASLQIDKVFYVLQQFGMVMSLTTPYALSPDAEPKPQDEGTSSPSRT